MKKFISVLLAVALCSSVMLIGLTSCSKGDTNTETATQLTYWAAMDPVLSTHVQSYNEVAMYKKYEEMTGVHIDFIHPVAGQVSEQFNLLIASGEYPDLIEYGWDTYLGGPRSAIDDKVIVPIDDYLEYAPNFKKALESSELADAYRRGSTLDDGTHYGFTTLNLGNFRTFGGPMIRRDWLDELGLEIPETINDWTEVLRAFKQKKGAVTPLTGSEFPENFVGAFKISSDFYADGDTVKYGPAQPEYKEFLAVMRQWYEEGLIDKDILTNKSTIVDAKMTDGSAGALVHGYIGATLGRYMAQKSVEDPEYDLTGAPYPVLKKGEVNSFARIEPDVVPSRTLAISTACKDPVTAVKWVDFWYSNEGYKLMNFGIEGESYNMVDGKPVYTDVILKNPDGLSINETLQLYCRATSPAPGFKQAPEYLEQYYQYPQQIESLKLWENGTDAARKTLLSGLQPTSEENDKISSLRTDLTTYVKEKRWAFITGKESLDNYDSFVQELKSKFGLDECLSIIQAQYDRYQKR